MTWTDDVADAIAGHTSPRVYGLPVWQCWGCRAIMPLNTLGRHACQLPNDLPYYIIEGMAE